MKTIAFGVLRHFLIPVAFMLAAEMPGCVNKIRHAGDGSVDPYRTFTREEFDCLEATPDNFFPYWDSVTALRIEQSRADAYGPMEYFRDYKQLQMFASLYVDYPAKDAGRFHFAVQPKINQLNALSHQKRKETYWDEVPRAREYWFPLEKAQRLASEQAPLTNWWQILWSPLLAWILRFYLHGLPIAFIMLLVWKRRVREEKEDAERHSWEPWRKDLRTEKTPASFLFSLAVWPIVLALDIRNRFKEAAREGEFLSRRSTMLNLFSKQEEQLLAMSRSMSMQEFRDYLDARGIVRKRSLVAGFGVACILVLVPRILFASPLAIHDDSDRETVVVQTDYGGTSEISIPVYDNADDMWALVPVSWSSWFETSYILSYFLSGTPRILSGFASDIGSVPKRYQISFV